MTVFSTRLTTIALLGAFASVAWGQGPAGSLLVIETTNRVVYTRDVADYSLLATNPVITTAAREQNFGQNILIRDIVSLNGTRVQGTVVGMLTEFKLRPDAPPGMAIADIRRNSWEEWYFEILDEDGRLIGSIRVSGLGSVQGFPNPPPGQTSRIISGSHVVVGGNGAFLGVQGYMGAVRPPVAARIASMAEDPANRRALGGGGTFTQGIYILPMFRPEVVTVGGRPAIVHSSDLSLVTANKPAVPGEVLTLFASGLGPTRPGVEPGE